MVVCEYLPHALEGVQHGAESVRIVERLFRIQLDRVVVERRHAKHGVDVHEHDRQNGDEQKLLGCLCYALDHDARAVEVDDDLGGPDDAQFGQVT